MKPHGLITILAAVTLGVSPVTAQAPGVPIEQAGPAAQASVLEKAKALREAGKLKLNIAAVKQQITTPVPGPLVLPAPSKVPLEGRDVAVRAHAGYLRFGWYYLCPRCDHWHVNLAGSYAIATDAIATCHHCVEQKPEMREGYLIAVDHTGAVLAVTAILAKSATMDAAILRVDGKLKALALNDNVAPGDAAYCYSAPLGQQGYFSAGIVNRFYWRGTPGAAGTPDEWKMLRLNVSTDWAPGSSGAAVLDRCGNVIGHVSTISPLGEGPRRAPVPPGKADGKNPAAKVDRFGGATLITLHEAVPARSVLSLATTLRDQKPADGAAAGSPPPAPISGR